MFNGADLKALLNRADISQTKLAAATGYSSTAISLCVARKKKVSKKLFGYIWIYRKYPFLVDRMVSEFNLDLNKEDVRLFMRTHGINRRTLARATGYSASFITTLLNTEGMEANRKLTNYVALFNSYPFLINELIDVIGKGKISKNSVTTVQTFS